MGGPSGSSTSLLVQSNALLRKNLTFQKRNIRDNIRIIRTPILFCLLLLGLQHLIDHVQNTTKCGCKCVDSGKDSPCQNVCGIKYSDYDQASLCAMPHPPEWPPLLQVPGPEYRAVRMGSSSYYDLPQTCRMNKSCPATLLYTGQNHSFAERVTSKFFPVLMVSENTMTFRSLYDYILGTDADTQIVDFTEAAFEPGRSLYIIQPRCPSNFPTFSIPIQMDNTTLEETNVECVEGINLWRNNSTVVNDELYRGFKQSNSDREINEVVAAYDFLNTNQKNFNVSIWYNSTYKKETASTWYPSSRMRVSRSINMVSNAYLLNIVNSSLKMQLEFFKEMPKVAVELKLDLASILSALFFLWIIQLLLPIILLYLVYEKEHNLRIMMKMHGLGDVPYMLISYGYFLSISSVYIVFLMTFGSVIGLKFFTTNDYTLQFVFYFTYINLQIAFAFLLVHFFSNVRNSQGLQKFYCCYSEKIEIVDDALIAQREHHAFSSHRKHQQRRNFFWTLILEFVIGIVYMYMIGGALLGSRLMDAFLADKTFPRHWILVMEIIPALSLYRGLYELGMSSFFGRYMATPGMRWKDLSDSENGMKDLLILMTLEWFVMLLLAYFLDQFRSITPRILKGPCSILQRFRREVPSSFRSSNLERQGSRVLVELDKSDVTQEREIVDQLSHECRSSYAVVSDNLTKVYPANDGSSDDKLAVQGLSLAVRQGECFGLLGPNGAGKTSFINMMIGLTSPTSGNAYVQGLGIRTDMDRIYTSMGVCPQHDMLWECLTGREHLLFYGRLKNLKGPALLQAVDESLRSINLLHGGFADKRTKTYSGGMKRRLSVAISLIGDPKVVYMDEPSSGLDPASRKNLWNVVKNKKQGRAIILTTHSMEEAEHLCDRLGIIVGGSFQCIGNSKQLKARHGGSYVFTVTTSGDEEEAVEDLANQLSPRAKKIYHILGTQKFEIPKEDVMTADVFKAVEGAKAKLSIQAWGLFDTTLEDVFIKVASEANFLL